MTHLQKLTLFRLVCNPTATPINSGHLLMQGHPTGRKLKGQQLVDQYSWGQRYVIFTSDDNLYEEVLHIYLLDLELNTVDEMDLSQPLTPGFYQACYHGRESLEFRFFDDTTWCLRIRSQPKTKAFNIDQFPVSRPLKLWGQQYLSLEPSQTNVA